MRNQTVDHNLKADITAKIMTTMMHGCDFRLSFRLTLDLNYGNIDIHG